MERFDKLASCLVQAGWNIAALDADEAMLGWWSAQTWTLESTWSECRLYLTFLVDPQDAAQVWGVGISRVLPTNRFEAEGEVVINFRRHWRSRLSDVLQAVNDMRAGSQQGRP